MQPPGSPPPSGVIWDFIIRLAEIIVRHLLEGPTVITLPRKR